MRDRPGTAGERDGLAHVPAHQLVGRNVGETVALPGRPGPVTHVVVAVE